MHMLFLHFHKHSNFSLKIVDETKIVTDDWDIVVVRTHRVGKVITVRIDATAKTINSAWIAIATGLPAPCDNYYYQGYDRENSGSYKILINTNGILKVSNRAAKISTYIDTAVTYIAE